MEIRQHSGPLWVLATVRLVWMSGPQELNQLRQAGLQEHEQLQQAGPAHAMGSCAATMRWSKPLGCIFSSLFFSCSGNVFLCVFVASHLPLRTSVAVCTWRHFRFIILWYALRLFFFKLNYIFTFTLMASIEISSSLLCLVFVFIDICYYIYFM